MHLKNLKKHFKRLQKYQYGNDYLFNEHNEEDYFSNNDIQRLQSFLVNVEVIFLVKKQRELEKTYQ